MYPLETAKEVGADAGDSVDACPDVKPSGKKRKRLAKQDTTPNASAALFAAFLKQGKPASEPK